MVGDGDGEGSAIGVSDGSTLGSEDGEVSGTGVGDSTGGVGSLLGTGSGDGV